MIFLRGFGMIENADTPCAVFEPGQFLQVVKFRPMIAWMASRPNCIWLRSWAPTWSSKRAGTLLCVMLLDRITLHTRLSVIVTCTNNTSSTYTLQIHRIESCKVNGKEIFIWNWTFCKHAHFTNLQISSSFPVVRFDQFADFSNHHTQWHTHIPPYTITHNDAHTYLLTRAHTRTHKGLTLEALSPCGGGSAESPNRTRGERDAGVENKNTQNTQIDLNRFNGLQCWTVMFLIFKITNHKNNGKNNFRW